MAKNAGSAVAIRQSAQHQLRRNQPGVNEGFLDAFLDIAGKYSLPDVTDDKRRRGTQDRLFTRILEEIDKTAGRVSLASATFHLVEAPTIDVRLKTS